MEQSSTLGHVIGTAASWLFMSLCMVGSVIYFDELRAAGRWALGVPALEQRAAATKSDQDAPASSFSSSGSVELRADRLGHFVTSAEVNGRNIDVMVDTGASIVAFTWEDAERAGIYVRNSDFTHQVQTANGTGR